MASYPKSMPTSYPLSFLHSDYDVLYCSRWTHQQQDHYHNHQELSLSSSGYQLWQDEIGTEVNQNYEGSRDAAEIKHRGESKNCIETLECATPTTAHISGRKISQRQQDKKRTEALNQAFLCLRGCLPDIPRDTKLSKLRTLRKAITYIQDLILLTNGCAD